jgi:thiosulfate/3-mercaptopyruvate sulfurtransferase
MTISPTVSLGPEPDTDHPLVDTAWLADRLGDPGLRVFDCTVHLRPFVPGPYVIESGRSDYELGHIPGAAFADIPADFSNPHSGLNFTLPQHDTLVAAFAAAGMGTDQTIVLYSSASPMWATRMWWMLRSAGHPRALVLDGGLAKWRAEGRAIATGRERYPAATFAAKPLAGLWADQAALRQAIGDGSVCTVNALSRALHTGESDIHYGRKGRIAGSVNLPHTSMLRDDGTYRSKSELALEFAAIGATAPSRVIVYCGGGIAATMDALALVLLGHGSVAVYDGSAAEWARDPALPMEVG